MEPSEQEVKDYLYSLGIPFPIRNEMLVAREALKFRRLVEKMMWVCPISNSSPSCASCGAMEHWGHTAETCEAVAALEGIKVES